MTLSTLGRYDAADPENDREVAGLRARIAADGPRLPLAAPVLDEAAARDAARKAVGDLVDAKAMDAVLAQIKGDGLRSDRAGRVPVRAAQGGPGAGLAAELTEHLGYDRHDAAGRGSGNSRNGSTPKTVETEVGPVVWTCRGTGRARSLRCCYPRTPAVWVECRCGHLYTRAG